MAFAAFEDEIPPEHQHEFLNGEKVVVTSDPANDAVVGTWYFARNFYVEPGIYNLKFIASGNCTLRIRTLAGNISASVDFVQGVLHVTQVPVPTGPQRIELVIEHPEELEGTACGFAMLLFMPDRVIYGSGAAGWVVSDVGYPTDLETPLAIDPDTLLPVFPFLPNWRDGIVEQIQYLTDVLTSESGSEQTRALRVRPIRSFEAEFIRTKGQRQRLDTFLNGLGRRYFLLPLWHEQFRPSAGIPSGTMSVNFSDGTLAQREFRSGDFVIVNNRDPEQYELLIVATVNLNSGQLIFEQGPWNDWPKGSRIMPLRKARLTERTDLRNPTDNVGITRLRFRLVDHYEFFDPDWGSNPPRFDFAFDRAEDVTIDHDRLAYWQDNTVGEPYVVDPGKTSFVGVRASVLLRGREEVLRYRKFLAAARGRARRFLMPTGNIDLSPLMPIGGTSLLARSTGYTEYAERLQESKSYLYVQFRDNRSPILTRVLHISSDGNTETFLLDRALPSVQPSQIKRIQFAIPSRFEQDTFDLLHYVDDGIAVRASVVTRTVRELVVGEPVEFLTTPIYPIEDMPEMSGDVTFDGGVLQEGIEVEDEFEGDIAFDDGSIREPIVEIEPEEELDGDLVWESGILRQVLLNIEFGPEGVDGDLDLEVGVLRQILVMTNVNEDRMNGNISFNGGAIHEY